MDGKIYIPNIGIEFDGKYQGFQAYDLNYMQLLSVFISLISNCSDVLPLYVFSSTV